MNPGLISVGYAEAAAIGLTPGASFMGRILASTNAAVARVTYIGDVNLDGQVDNKDIRALATSGLYQDGLNTHVWSQGDFNGDGAFDNKDIRAVATSGIYNGPNYDVAWAPLAAPTPKLSSASSEAGVVAASVGPVIYNYNPSTGDVTVNVNGNANVVEVDLLSAGNKFIVGGSKLAADGMTFITNSTHEQDGFSSFGSFIADATDLGNILPANLTLAQLTADLTALYSIQGNPNQLSATLAVPEPTAFSLFMLGGLGILGRRRRGVVGGTGVGGFIKSK